VLFFLAHVRAVNSEDLINTVCYRQLRFLVHLLR